MEIARIFCPQNTQNDAERGGWRSFSFRVFCVFCGKEFSSLILAVQLPGEEVEFLEARAKKHATSVAEIFTRYARRLQNTTGRTPHPETVKFTGSVNADVDAREACRKHIVDKHR